MSAAKIEQPEKTTAIATVQPSAGALLRPVASPSTVVQVHQEAIALIKEALVEGEDYGVIPGTEKPTLLKPGAERIAIAFGARARYAIVEKEIDHDRPIQWVKRKGWGGESFGFYRYVIECRLELRDGTVIGEALGSCSTLESKYVDRPRDCENTALKMAQKRALVAVVLGTFGLSNRFAQDVEDLPAKDEQAESFAQRARKSEPRKDTSQVCGPGPYKGKTLDDVAVTAEYLRQYRADLQAKAAEALKFTREREAAAMTAKADAIGRELDRRAAKQKTETSATAPEAAPPSGSGAVAATTVVETDEQCFAREEAERFEAENPREPGSDDEAA